MDYNEVLDRARKTITPACKVCKECNGTACKGQTTGVGGKGKGNSFIRNYEFLNKVKINMDTMYENKGQDINIELFGKKFAAPIFAAPIGGIIMNYNNNMNDFTYSKAVVNGTIKAGIAAFTADGVKDEAFMQPLEAVKMAGGIAIPTIKPWANNEVIEKIRLSEDAGVVAIAMDIDAAGLTKLKDLGKPVFPKSVKEISQLVESTKLPFILKGIMTASGALKAVEAGVYGIVVSNHGGRVLDDTPATCEMLEEIREAVGDKLKIFVDGGIRTGADVFKAIALGADAVLIGRPYVTAAFGADEEGVEIYTVKIMNELKEVMLMTGCNKLSDIDRSKIVCLD